MPEIEVLTDTVRSVLNKIGWQILTPSDSFVNWDIVNGIAWDFADVSELRFLGGEEENRKELVGIYQNIIERILPLISDYVEEPWPQKVDPVLVFDRAEWIVVNIENLKSLLSDVSQDYWEALGSYMSLTYPIGQKVAKKVSEISLTSELGFLFGYISKKVLAQYDFGLHKANGVVPGEFFYFVEPNIIRLEEKFGLDPTSLRLWITLHEVTHSFQFNAFPWLKDHINSLVHKYLGLVDEAIKDFKKQADEGRAVSFGGTGWWKDLLSPENRRLIKEVQALMCLIEGYSEHVMMQVGKNFPNHSEMLGIFKERKKRKTVAEQLLEKLIGFDLKIKQYTLGEKFSSFVTEKEGIKFLNRVWENKENLPAWNEIHDPDVWIKRMKLS